MIFTQIKEIVDSCKKRLGKPRAYTGTFVPPQQQEQSCSPSQQPSMPQKQDAFMLAGGNKMSPTESTIPFSGAPKPSFTLNQPKSKPKPSNKGFKQEIKNLLKSDTKQSLKIEQK